MYASFLPKPGELYQTRRRTYRILKLVYLHTPRREKNWSKEKIPIFYKYGHIDSNYAVLHKKGLQVSNPRILEKKDVSQTYQNIQITKKKQSASTFQ